MNKLRTSTNYQQLLERLDDAARTVEGWRRAVTVGTALAALAASLTAQAGTATNVSFVAFPNEIHIRISGADLHPVARLMTIGAELAGLERGLA